MTPSAIPPCRTTLKSQHFPLVSLYFKIAVGKKIWIQYQLQTGWFCFILFYLSREEMNKVQRCYGKHFLPESLAVTRIRNDNKLSYNVQNVPNNETLLLFDHNFNRHFFFNFRTKLAYSNKLSVVGTSPTSVFSFGYSFHEQVSHLHQMNVL
jgi:hypothetical protein